MEFIEIMWNKYKRYNGGDDLVYEDEIRSLFYILFLLIIKEDSCATEREYWIRLEQYSRKYMFDQNCEENFGSLISGCYDEQIKRYYEVLLRLKYYKILFSTISVKVDIILISEYGCESVQESRDNCFLMLPEKK